MRFKRTLSINLNCHGILSRWHYQESRVKLIILLKLPYVQCVLRVFLRVFVMKSITADLLINRILDCLIHLVSPVCKKLPKCVRNLRKSFKPCYPAPTRRWITLPIIWLNKTHPNWNKSIRIGRILILICRRPRICNQKLHSRNFGHTLIANDTYGTKRFLQ